MKYLALMGSFRKNKNTEIALDAFLEGVEEKGHEIKKLYIRDLDIKNCTGCDYCSDTGHCIFKDDMNLLYDEIDSCDRIVIAAPIYFNSINALTKTVIDRFQRYWGIKYGYGREKIEIKDKLGMSIAVGGAKFTLNRFHYGTAVIKMAYDAINTDLVGVYNIAETDDYPVSERNEIIEELKDIGRNFETSKKFIIQR